MKSNDFEQTALPQMSLLYNYALKLTLNSEDAKDLLQETYLKAYRYWDKFEKGTNIKGWLSRIMRNSFINLYRKNSKEPKKIEYDESQYAHYIHQHRLPGLIDQKEKSPHEIFVDEIAQSIESLPSIFRTVVLLSAVEELTYDEIAKMVACPIGTVRSRLHRGRKALQRKLLPYALANGYVIRKFANLQELR